MPLCFIGQWVGVVLRRITSIEEADPIHPSWDWEQLPTQSVTLAHEPTCKVNRPLPLLPRFSKYLLKSLGLRSTLEVHLVQVPLGASTMGDTEQNLACGLVLTLMSLSFLRCLTPDAETRPDIVEVSSMISDIMMKYVDNLSTSQLALEKKLERERRRTQRYFMEANRNAITCQQEPTLLSQVNGILPVFSGWVPIGVWGCSCLS